jgi:uncharacterized membrane protein YphA (DoxX/SURF4 family)
VRTFTRVAFRFAFVYLTLYALATQLLGGLLILPGVALPALGTVWPMRDITVWVAEHVFGLTPPLNYRGTSGDTAFHWVQTFWILIVAVAITAAWVVWDRRGRRDVILHAWFRLFLRFALAAEMFYFGMAKVIPAQFPPPALVTLVEPVGHLSLSNLLWVFIGSSTPYQMFTGIAEMVGGLLLLVPQTTMLGALICLADMLHVFVLNMSYDVGLKQISLHLALVSLFLLAPEAPRLARMFLQDRPVPASTLPHLFGSARASRIALAAQIVFGLYLVVMFTTLSVRFWYAEGGPGSPKSVLYGIWDVTELSVDGEARPVLENDYDRRWRRVIFDSPQRIIFQRTDDSFLTYGVTIHEPSRTMALTKGSSRTWSSAFTYNRPADDRLVLEGHIDGHRIRADLQLVPLDIFRLLNSRFRWIRPPDSEAG